MARASLAGRRATARICVTLFCAVGLAGCGRLGFERQELDGGGTDAPPPVPDGPDGASLDAGVAPDGSPPPEGGTPGDDGGVDGGPDAGAPDGGAPADAGPTCPPAVTDYCATIPSLSDAPTLDGELEPCLGLAVLEPVGWLGPGDSPPSAHRTEYAVAWRPGGLYFFLRVTDPHLIPANDGDSTWCGDGVEVYVDHDGRYDDAPSYDDPGTRQGAIAAPEPGQADVLWAELYCRCSFSRTPLTSGFAAWARDDGYVVEGMVDAAFLGLDDWRLAPGDTVGLDLGANVSKEAPSTEPCDNRLGQYFLRVAGDSGFEDAPFRNASAFCTAELLP